MQETSLIIKAGHSFGITYEDVRKEAQDNLAVTKGEINPGYGNNVFPQKPPWLLF